MKVCLYLIYIMLMLPTFAFARPVSYPGGITLMQMNDMDSNSIHLHYSPTAKYSIGYKGEYWRDEKWQIHGTQLNNLLKRWNKPASQANVYLKSGIGIVIADNNDTDFGAFTGVSLDWENRRFFTLYENRVYDAGDIGRFFSQKARVGIAPYIGDYGDFHTWLMLQVDHRPEADDPITVTPLVRFFKDVYLAELGISEDGDALINLIIRF